MRVQGHLERGAALEAQAAGLRPVDAERHRDLGLAVADDLSDEAVAVARVDDDLEAVQLGPERERHPAGGHVDPEIDRRARELDA